jgi:N-acetylglucosaminyldiphosphoundecaprenol N-acetyl-beta-D-mannosaminyltransferase
MTLLDSAIRSTLTDVDPLQPPHVEFLGLPFSLLSAAQALDLILARRGAPYRYVVTPNAHHVVTAHGQPERLLPIYRDAWLSLCDSRIVRALARLDDRALPLVTGSDLVAALLSTLNSIAPSANAASSESSWSKPPRLLIVGPQRTVGRALHDAYPELRFSILTAPAGLGKYPQLRHAISRACLDLEWDILLLCVGCPAQELIARQLGQLGRTNGVALCVGASIDFLTCPRGRAPRWMQKLGLEWAWRLGREPGRLWRRYLLESPRIFRIFLAARGTHGDEVEQ